MTQIFCTKNVTPIKRTLEKKVRLKTIKKSKSEVDDMF